MHDGQRMVRGLSGGGLLCGLICWVEATDDAVERPRISSVEKDPIQTYNIACIGLGTDAGMARICQCLCQRRQVPVKTLCPSHQLSRPDVSGQSDVTQSRIQIRSRDRRAANCLRWRQTGR